MVDSNRVAVLLNGMQYVHGSEIILLNYANNWELLVPGKAIISALIFPRRGFWVLTDTTFIWCLVLKTIFSDAADLFLFNLYLLQLVSLLLLYLISLHLSLRLEKRKRLNHQKLGMLIYRDFNVQCGSWVQAYDDAYKSTNQLGWYTMRIIDDHSDHVIARTTNQSLLIVLEHSISCVASPAGRAEALVELRGLAGGAPASARPGWGWPGMRATWGPDRRQTTPLLLVLKEKTINLSIPVVCTWVQILC